MPKSGLPLARRMIAGEHHITIVLVQLVTRTNVNHNRQKKPLKRPKSPHKTRSSEATRKQNTGIEYNVKSTVVVFHICQNIKNQNYNL